MEIFSYYWQFGDGQVSFEQNPSHIYLMPGTYTWICQAVFSNGVTLTTTGIEYVYDYNYDYSVDESGEVTFEGLIASRTHKCFRFAIPQRIEQGVGWAEYAGDWPMAVGETGSIKVKDENEEFKMAVIDGSTFKAHELGLDEQWSDGEDEYAGSVIESEILLREEIPPIGASAILQHEQSHAYIKPWLKERRDIGEYDSEGYREGFNMDAYIRINGAPTNHAITKEIPYKGQLVFDRKCKSENLQIGWTVRVAPWRFIRTQTWYRQIDSAAPPEKKTMSEMDWAMAWSTPALWIARNINPLLDAATGGEATGVYLGITTGPDGYASAIVIAGTTINLGNVDLPADFTFSVWLKITGMLNIDITGAVWAGGGALIGPGFVPTADWTMLTITRENNIARYYQDGVIFGTQILTAIDHLIGMLFIQGDTSFTDAIVVNRLVSADGILYRYNDMHENHGNATCPIM